MWNALVRALGTSPSRDVKSYNRLILRCLAGWIVVALSVAAIGGWGLGGALIAIGWALGLAAVTARCIDRRFPLPKPADGPDGDG